MGSSPLARRGHPEGASPRAREPLREVDLGDSTSAAELAARDNSAWVLHGPLEVRQRRAGEVTHEPFACDRLLGWCRACSLGDDSRMSGAPLNAAWACNPVRRRQITASPLRAAGEQMAGDRTLRARPTGSFSI